MENQTPRSPEAALSSAGSYHLELSETEGICGLPARIYSVHLYILDLASYDLTQWTITYVAQWLIMTLQIIAFLSNNYVEFHWNNAVSKIVMGVATFVTELPWSLSTDFYFSLGILMTYFFAGCFATFSHHMYSWVVPVYFCRYLLMWIPTVFFIPLMMPHFKIIFGCLAYSADSFTYHPFAHEEFVCWQGTHITYFVIAFFVGTAFFVSSAIVNLCYFNAELPRMINVRHNPINASNSNRPVFFLFLAKTVLLILLLAGHARTWRFAMSLIFTGVGLSATYLHTKYLPHWSEFAQWLSLSQTLIFSLLGVATFLNLVLDDHEGTGMLFFVAVPVVMILAAALVRWRYNQVAFISERDMDSPELVVAKAQATIRGFVRRVSSFGSVYVEDMPEVQEAREEAMSACEAIFVVGLRRFPESAALHIFVAQFHTLVAFNRVLAYRELDAAAQCDCGPDETYRTRLIRHALGTDTRKDRSVEVLGYLEFAERRAFAYSAAANAMRHLLSFWSHLLTSEPSLAHLAREGQAARAHLSSCEAQLQKLLELNPHSVLAHRLYALLCAEILGDTARAVALLERVDHLEQWREKRMTSCNFSDFLRVQGHRPDIFDENNGVVTISMKEEKLGVIELANTALARQLGWRRSGEIIGKNISSIIPEPIKSHHTDYLRDYLTSKRSRVVGHVRLVLAQHQQGHLKGFSMYVRWADEALGKMIAVLQPLDSPNEICMLVQPSTQRITASTATLYSLLGYNRRALAAGNIALNHVIPALNSGDTDDEAWNAVRSLTGLRTPLPHALTGAPIRAHCFVVPLTVHEEVYFMARIQISETHAKETDATAIAGAPVEESDSEVDEEARAAAALTVTAPSPKQKRQYSATALQGPAASMYLAPTATDKPSLASHGSSNSSFGRSGRSPGRHTNKRGQPSDHRAFDALGEYRDITQHSLENVEAIAARRREEERAIQKESLQSAQKRRIGQGHLRLKRAIENDNKRAVGRLGWLKVASVSLLIVLITLQVVQHVWADKLTHESEHYLEYVHQSSLRGSYITDTVFHYRIYNALFAIPLPGLTNIFYKVGVHPSPSMQDVFNAYRDRTERSLEAMRTISMRVDLASVDNAQMTVYRKTDMFPIEFLHLTPTGKNGAIKQGVRHAKLSLPDAMLHFTALGNFGLFEKVKDDAHDHGYFFMLTNTVLGYFEAANEAGSRVFMAEVAQAQEIIFTIGVVCVALSLAIILFVALVFFRPLLVEVDAAKLTVLEIFLSVPAPLRRKLRATALNVYHAVRQSQLQFEAAASQENWDEVAATRRAEDEVDDSSDTNSEAEDALAVGDGWSGLFNADALNVNATQWEKQVGTSGGSAAGRTHEPFRIVTDERTGATSHRSGQSALSPPIYPLPQSRSLGADWRQSGTLDTPHDNPHSFGDEVMLSSLNLAIPNSATDPATTIANTESSNDDSNLALHSDSSRSASMHSLHSPSPHSALMHTETSDLPLLIADAQGDAKPAVLSTDAPARSSTLDDTPLYTPLPGNISTSALPAPAMHSVPHLTPPAQHRSLAGSSAAERYAAAQRASSPLTSTLHHAQHQSDALSTHALSTFSINSGDGVGMGKNAAAQRAKTTLGNRTAIRAALLRVILFMACVGAYYTAILIISYDHKEALNADAMFLYIAAQRLPKLQLSFFYASVNTLFDRDTLIKYDPINPLTRRGPFWEEAQASWDLAEEAIFSVVYGNTAEISTAVSSTEQDVLMYGDACSITPERAAQLYTPTAPIDHLWSTCDTFEGGVFHRGFLVALRVYEDAIRQCTVKKASLALENNIFGSPAKPQHGQAYVDKLLIDYRRANILMNDYLFHWLMISAGLYRDHISDLVNSFMTTRLVLFCVFLALTVLSYWLLFAPLVAALARGIAETNSMMLLLPPAVVKHVPAAQEYIREHIARD